MGSVLDAIEPPLADWLEAQPVFFVGSAPLAADGHVNLSPKGLAGTFRVLGGHAVAYLDLTGSGVETIAHLRENGRIVLMFCAFDGRPRIVRLYGRGRVVLPGTDEFDGLIGRFSEHPGVRSIVVVGVTRATESCGYGVPAMRYEADREVLDLSARKKGEDGLVEYRRERNATSIDGLPGFPT